MGKVNPLSKQHTKLQNKLRVPLPVDSSLSRSSAVADSMIRCSSDQTTPSSTLHRRLCHDTAAVSVRFKDFVCETVIIIIVKLITYAQFHA